MPRERWWQASVFLPQIERLAAWSAGFLPPRLKDVLDLHQQTVAPADTQPVGDQDQPLKQDGSE